MDFGTTTTLFGLIIFILDIMALFKVLTSHRSIGYKLIWSLVILFMPLIGLILYAVFGDTSRTAAA